MIANAALISALAVLLAVSGQVLWKMSVTTLGFALLTNPVFMAGTLLYICSTGVYLVAVSRFPLSVVYPFMGMTFVVVLLPAHFLLGERIDMYRIVGALLIAGGISISAFGSR